MRLNVFVAITLPFLVAGCANTSTSDAEAEGATLGLRNCTQAMIDAVPGSGSSAAAIQVETQDTENIFKIIRPVEKDMWVCHTQKDGVIISTKLESVG